MSPQLLMTLLFIFSGLRLFVVTDSFTKNDKFLHKLQLRSQSYGKMLQRSGIKRGGVVSSSTMETSVSRGSHLDKESASITFSDEMYEHLKIIISKLTAKIKHDISLSPQELISLKRSIDAVISEAQGVGLPSHRLSSKISTSVQSAALKSSILPLGKESTLNSLNPFEGFSDLRSTWNVPGMDDMTTDQYYSALNDRNRRIQEARKESGDHRPDEYQHFIATLSRK